jgi:anthranilate phosphoribosyltransferase
MPHDNASLIRVAVQGGSELGVDNARVLFAAMLAGEVAQRDLEQILAAWRRRRASLAELTGFMRALDAHSGRLEEPHEGPRPILLPAYHGTRRQANLTALVALLLQRYEIPVLVHGLEGEAGSNAPGQWRAEGVVSDPDFAAPVGPSGHRVATADVLRELGIEPATSLADAQARLRHDKVAYAPVALLAPGLGRLLLPPTRDSLPTIVHSLALLIDPFAGDGYRVIGAPSAAELAAVREFLLASRTDALLFLGTEGEPYADPRRQTRLEHVAAGVVTLCADVEGEDIEREPSLPAASDAPTTAAWIANVLAGALPVPPPLIMQLGCCLAGAHRLGAAA